MSWDQPQFSFSYGNPPTPIGTPTTNLFGQSATFPTPKPESSFDDPRITWDTSNPYATSPSFSEYIQGSPKQTPTLSAQTPTQPPMKRTPVLNLEAQFASAVSHPSPNPSIQSAHNLRSPHIGSSSTQPSPRGEVSFAHTFATSPGLGLVLNTDTQRVEGTLRTPPPSTTSAAKKEAREAHMDAWSSQPTASIRRMSVPVYSNSIDAALSQVQQDLPIEDFSISHLSGDGFDFSSFGPATAPAYPQQKLFWDTHQASDTGVGLDVDFSVPFDSSVKTGLEPYRSLHQPFETAVDGFTFFPDESGSGDQNHAFAAAINQSQISFDFSSTMTENQPLQPIRSAIGVNPTLIHSSPSRLLRPRLANAGILGEGIMQSLQPYSTHLQEVQRNSLETNSLTLKRKRKPTTDSPAVKAALETLREDEVNNRLPRLQTTIPPARRSSSIPAKRTASHSNNVKTAGMSIVRPATASQRRRSPSPPKKPRYQPTTRPSISLTIDASGRARTETRMIVDNLRAQQNRSPFRRDGSVSTEESSSDEEEDDAADQMPTFSFKSSFPASNTTAAAAKRIKANVTTRNKANPPNKNGTRFASVSSTPFSHSQKSSSTSIFSNVSRGAETDASAWTPPKASSLAPQVQVLSGGGAGVGKGRVASMPAVSSASSLSSSMAVARGQGRGRERGKVVEDVVVEDSDAETVLGNEDAEEVVVGAVGRKGR
ncbi:hypothetical protein MMC25_005223 [Agyrium rufum]|nr:hypothetical protein [Agyrium rufum]